VQPGQGKQSVICHSLLSVSNGKKGGGNRVNEHLVGVGPEEGVGKALHSPGVAGKCHGRVLVSDGVRMSGGAVPVG